MTKHCVLAQGLHKPKFGEKELAGTKQALWKEEHEWDEWTCMEEPRKPALTGETLKKSSLDHGIMFSFVGFSSIGERPDN